MNYDDLGYSNDDALDFASDSEQQAAESNDDPYALTPGEEAAWADEIRHSVRRVRAPREGER